MLSRLCFSFYRFRVRLSAMRLHTAARSYQRHVQARIKIDVGLLAPHYRIPPVSHLRPSTQC